MKKHLSIILTIIGSMLLLNAATAQNVIIDYQTWNPSSPPCNIFGAAINVPRNHKWSKWYNSACIAHWSASAQLFS